MCKKQGKIGENKSQIVRDVPLACADEDAAVEFIERLRWGGQCRCPRCGSDNVYQMKSAKTGERNRRYLWRCRTCPKKSSQFTWRVGTVMEDSRIPARHWCFAFWRAATSKKGVAAKEIQRQTGLSYKASLFLLHRVRFAMAPTDGDAPKLTGTVEADETYIGGKPRKSKPQKGTKGKSNYQTRSERLTPVFAAVQRDGQARVRVIPDVTAPTLRKAVKEHIDLSSRLMTDERSGYIGVGKEFEGGHEQIAHKNNIYVRGDVTTNAVEGFFGNLKRGINGIYHSVSKKHLQRYLDEFEFRYNHRKMDDGDRVEAAVQGGEGKRLMYREPVAKAG